MQKDKWIVITAIVVTLVLFGGAVFGYWYLNRPHKQLQRAVASSTDSSSDSSSSGATGQGTGGLSIQSQGSQSGGQGGFSLQDNTSQSSSPSSSSSSSSGQAKQAPGPETFAQYDQYKDNNQVLFGDISVGTGTEVTAGTKVAVKYQGWLTNGKLFDQSTDKAIAFTVGNHEVILGWEQGLMGMKVGGKRRLIVPPAVGYGAQGKENVIPPNAVMVFDIELTAAL